MPKLTKRYLDTIEPKDADYFLWDDELSGFGLRVFASGKRSYLIQYRAAGRTRRFTIGSDGIWAPEEARREARSLLGRVAKGENPAEERVIDRNAITVKELCERYLADAENGLILGKTRMALFSGRSVSPRRCPRSPPIGGASSGTSSPFWGPVA
jgi:hypothetical protein